MKRIRKLLCPLLAALLVVSLTVGAWADEETEIPAEPTAAPEVTAAPEATATPEATAAPEATATPEPSDTPEPTATPEVTATPEASNTPLRGTANVPTPSYTLNIPAEQTVAFGASSHTLALPTVSGSSGFAEGQSIALSVSCTAFTCETVSTTIPFTLKAVTLDGTQYAPEAGTLCYRGEADGSAAATPSLVLPESGAVELAQLMLLFAPADWQRALGGEYTASITFQTQVVTE